MGEVTITAMEYRELVLKAYKYDKLRKICVDGSFASTEESFIYEITEEEAKAIEERRRERYGDLQD